MGAGDDRGIRQQARGSRVIHDLGFGIHDSKRPEERAVLRCGRCPWTPAEGGPIWGHWAAVHGGVPAARPVADASGSISPPRGRQRYRRVA